MPTRRLLALVAVLIGLTLVAAMLSPAPREPVPASTPEASPAAGGDAVEVTLDAGAGQRDVEVGEGDVVRLLVSSDTLDSVELQGLDLIRTVAPETPAEFDLLADEPGDYPIVLTAENRTAGTLRVTPAAR